MNIERNETSVVFLSFSIASGCLRILYGFVVAAIDKVRGQEAEEVERVCVSSNGCPVEQHRIWSDIRGIGWSRVFPRERVEWIRVRSGGD